MNFNKIKICLKKHEGKRNTMYTDSVGVETIGFGHNLHTPISDAACEQILEDDVHNAVYELDRVFNGWREHPESVQDVLVQLSFNMGVTRLSGFVKMWAALDKRDYQEAASELLDSRYADQVGQRAEDLAAEMMEVH